MDAFYSLLHKFFGALGKEVLSQFFERLTPEQRASIRYASADGAKWITSCVEEYCPHAQRCADPFHVVSWATDALDQVRREARSEARQQAKTLPKRKPGRPAKGEAAPEKNQAKSVKNLRYVLLARQKISLGVYHVGSTAGPSASAQGLTYSFRTASTRSSYQG